MRIIVIDTNVFLRYLLNDHPIFSKKAKKLFLLAQHEKIELYLDEIVLAEIIWTLSSYHKIPKNQIKNSLKILISQRWIVNPRKKLMLETLDNFALKKVDYIDSWLFVVANSLKLKIGSLDKDFNRLNKKIIYSLSF